MARVRRDISVRHPAAACRQEHCICNVVAVDAGRREEWSRIDEVVSHTAHRALDLQDVTRFNESMDLSLTEVVRSFAEQVERDRTALLASEQAPANSA